MLKETNLNDDGTIWIKTTPDGKPLIVGQNYCFVGQWWVYAGDFESSDQVPNINCCYTIGNQIKIRRGIPMGTPQVREKIKRVRKDDSRPINTDISDQDGPLLIMMKEALAKEGVTKKRFKDFYESDSDFNNCLRHIETQNTLSWSRFDDLRDRMGLECEVTLKHKDGSIVSHFDSANPVVPEPITKKKK